MKADYTTNSHYITYTFLYGKVGKMYTWSNSPDLRPCFPSASMPTGRWPDGVRPFSSRMLSLSSLDGRKNVMAREWLGGGGGGGQGYGRHSCSPKFSQLSNKPRKLLTTLAYGKEGQQWNLFACQENLLAYWTLFCWVPKVRLPFHS